MRKWFKIDISFIFYSFVDQREMSDLTKKEETIYKDLYEWTCWLAQRSKGMAPFYEDIDSRHSIKELMRSVVGGRTTFEDLLYELCERDVLSFDNWTPIPYEFIRSQVLNPHASGVKIADSKTLEKELMDWVLWLADSTPDVWPLREDEDKLKDFQQHVKSCVAGTMTFLDLCYELWNNDVVCVSIEDEWYPLPFKYIKSQVINPHSTSHMKETSTNSIHEHGVPH